MHAPRRLRLSGESYCEQRVIGIDWRGSAEIGQLPPRPDLANYSVRQHALDMLAALDELRIDFCRLATRSTGDIIGARMLLKQPQRFGRVFTPPIRSHRWAWLSMQSRSVFRSIITSREVTRAVMATAASSLFDQASAPGALRREGWLDCPDLSAGIFNAEVPARDGFGYRTRDEYLNTGPLRRLFWRVVWRPCGPGVNWRTRPRLRGPFRPGASDPVARSAAGSGLRSPGSVCHEGMTAPGKLFPA